MASASAALFAWLSADPDVQSLAGSRIFPNKLPQGATFPAITYNVSRGTRRTGLSGPVGLASAWFQVHCYGLSYADAEALRNAIRGDTTTPKLDGYSGTVGGVQVQAAHVPTWEDVYHEPVHADDTGVHDCVLDVEIWITDI